MKDEIEAGVEPAAPVWAVFGDLMSVMLGAFVLVLMGVIGIQLRGQAASRGNLAPQDAGRNLDAAPDA
jgi:hypothetical protein